MNAGQKSGARSRMVTRSITQSVPVLFIETRKQQKIAAERLQSAL
jgi:hypothetical protein